MELSLQCRIDINIKSSFFIAYLVNINRNVLRKLQEAKEIQRSIDNDRTFPKKFGINNEFVNIEYYFKLGLMSLVKKMHSNCLKVKQLQVEKDFFASSQVRI